MKNALRCFLGILALVFGLVTATQAQTVDWIRQLGTSSSDVSRSVSADGLGNVYISGMTQGNLQGTNSGSWDTFVSKYDARGSLQWTQQLGTSSSEESLSVSADGLGNVYISGHTKGNLQGTNSGLCQQVRRRWLAPMDASAWHQQ